MKNWYILRGEKKHGPFSHEKMGEIVASGALRPDDFVWTPGFSDWTCAASVPGLLTPPPPISAGGCSAVPLQSALVDDDAPLAHQSEEPSPQASDSSPLATDAREAESSSRNSSYFLRHWRGELSLPVSYWLNCFSLNVAFKMIFENLSLPELSKDYLHLYLFSMVIMWSLVAVITLWQAVGVWRSARNYMHEGRSKLFGGLARLSILLILFNTANIFVSVAAPQIIEFSKIAIGHDPIGSYQLRVLRDATELEFSGSIVFGLTDDVKKMLDSHPTIRVIHLNTRGGRVSEARRLRDLINSRRLTTFTSSGCFSAGTLAYVAGSRRLIAREASLGFHQYSFPGVPEEKFLSEYEKDKRDWLSKGVSRSFVEKAFTTPHSDMWTPSHRELMESGFVTGYPDSDDVAMSGVQLSELEKISSELLKEPMFAALQEYDAELYDHIVAQVKEGFIQGHSLADLRLKIHPLVVEAYKKALPYGSDTVVCSAVALVLEQMKVLYTVDPVLCFNYIYGDGRRVDPLKYFSIELQNQEKLIIANLLRSAVGYRYQPPTESQIAEPLGKIVMLLAKKYGSDAQMLSDPKWLNTNKARACEISYVMFHEILKMPERDAGPLLRYIFSQVSD